MSDKDFFHEDDPVIRLRLWGLGQMVWGAFLAGVFVVAVGAVLLGIWAVGQFLPEESKQAPSPYGAMTLTSPDRVA